MDEDQEDVTEKSVCLKKRKESALESPKSEKNKKMLTESKQKNKKRTYDMSAWFTDYMINGQILSHTPLLQKNREMNDDDNESMCSESSSGSSSTSAIPEALDGGYGWVIVLCSFFIHFICDGISFSFGVIFPEIQKNFGTNKFVSSIPGSLFLSIPLLGGPIAALLTDLYDCRAMTIVGALIATFGVILSYFSTGIVSFTICYGIITAFGLCLCFNTAIVIVTYYFEKKRALATAIACCGTGAGTIIYPPLCELLISHLGWHSFLLCQAGWLLLLTVCGFFIRDVEWPQDSLEYKREKFIRKMERKRLRKQRQECNYNNQFFDHPYNAFYIPTVLQYKNRLALSLPEIPTHHRLTIKKAELGNSSASIHDGVYKTMLQEEMFTHLRSKSYGNFLRDNRKNSNESKKENKLLKRIESTALEIEKNENLLHLDLECGSLFNGKISQSKGCSTLSHSLNALDLQISSEEENSLGITSSVSSDEEDDCSNKSVDGESRYQKEVESVCSPKNTGTVKFMDKNPLSNMKMTGLSTELENTMSPRDAFLATQPNQPNRLSSLISATLTSTHGRVPATNALIACGQRMNRANIMNHHFKNKVPSAPNIFIKRRKRLRKSVLKIKKIWELICETFAENWELFNIPKFRFFLFSTFLLYMFFDIPYVNFPEYAVQRFGITEQQSSLLVSGLGACNMFAMLALGIIADWKYTRNKVLQIYGVFIVLAGCCVFLVPFVDTFPLMVMLAAFFGIFISANYVLASVLTVDLLSFHYFQSGYGLLNLIQGIGNLFGPAFVGFMHDKTGSYTSVFMIGSVCMMSSGVIVLLIHYYKKIRGNNKRARFTDPVIIEDGEKDIPI